MGSGQVDITPFEFTLWALGCIALGVLLGFPMGGITALRHFVPAHLLVAGAEDYLRKAAEGL